ncbi:hypothetical protein BC831DRAFT_478005 [Entophlyctis helioformis]|nr:hypothetical protein BC831DRAFT_478005 [Entophlyctis helioformis]
MSDHADNADNTVSPQAAAPPAGFSSALEKAKAMAAKFAADAKAAGKADDAPATAPASAPAAAPSHGLKRANEDADHEARPPPSSGYRKNDEADASSASQDHSQMPHQKPPAPPQYQQPAMPYGQQHQGAPHYGQPPSQYGAMPPAPYGAGAGGPPFPGGDQGRPRFGAGQPGGPPGSHYGPPGGAGSDMRKTVEAVVPPGKAGIVIGRGGETLKGIERQFNVRVQLEPAGGSPDMQKMAIITGHERDVEEARKAIQDIIYGLPRGTGGPGGPGGPGVPPMGAGYGAPFGAGGPPAPYGSTTIHIHVPSNNVGLIIGKGGETIKTLQQRSGARITVAKEHEMEPGSTARLVTIIGTEQAVGIAQHLVNEVISQHQFQRQVASFGPPAGGFGPTGMYCEIVMISATKVGLVIGRGGETIKAIQNEFGVNLKVDPNSDANGDRRVAIYGTPDSVARAKEAVYDRASSVRGARGRDGDGYGQQQQQQPQQQFGYAYQTPIGYGADAQQQQQTGQPAYDYSAYGQYDPAAYAAAYGQAAAAAATTADGQPAYDASQYNYDPKAYADYYAQYAAQYYGQFDPNAAAAATAAGQPGAPAAAAAGGGSAGEKSGAVAAGDGSASGTASSAAHGANGDAADASDAAANPAAEGSAAANGKDGQDEAKNGSE